jgi:hypothetical protein
MPTSAGANAAPVTLERRRIGPRVQVEEREPGHAGLGCDLPRLRRRRVALDGRGLVRRRPGLVEEMPHPGHEPRGALVERRVGHERQGVADPDAGRRSPVAQLRAQRDRDARDRAPARVELADRERLRREGRHGCPQERREHLRARAAVEPLAGGVDLHGKAGRGQVEQAAYVVEVEVGEQHVEPGRPVEQPRLGYQPRRAGAGVEQQGAIAGADEDGRRPAVRRRHPAGGPENPCSHA